ncbi:hypothetical protein GDO86_003588 [Hymenochirus boettgeri]|uniref:Uncharacterized protein n=1 Tax=Hymenochirus boettgeri TaxID=247094 RepID=A0A8T2K1N2_9PIPI|nr:hypothetical protein GDO86_003588 [Hymenochirus boettgeri]
MYTSIPPDFVNTASRHPTSSLQQQMTEKRMLEIVICKIQRTAGDISHTYININVSFTVYSYFVCLFKIKPRLQIFFYLCSTNLGDQIWTSRYVHI